MPALAGPVKPVGVPPKPVPAPTLVVEQPKPKVVKPKKVIPTYTEPPPRPILYPSFKCVYYISGMEDREDIPEDWRPGPITADMAKAMLGWLSQSEYTARCLADPEYTVKNPDGTIVDSPTETQIKESTLFSNNPEIFVLLEDNHGEEVTCENNNNNRPFRDKDCKAYVQTILNRDWAGPLTIEGETCNGETIIISRTGNVESGQHRLVALILAVQTWYGASGAKHKANWPTEPVLESLVVFGASDHPKVLMTLDNVIPRDGADTIYTSETFKDIRPKDRAKLSKMLERCVEMAWKRTGVAESGAGVNHRTNPETMRFLKNHGHLESAVRHLFDEDKQNGISQFNISVGQCAALLYFMGCSATDGEAINEYVQAQPRTEEPLTWERWDIAKDFWRKLVKDNKVRKGDKEEEKDITIGRQFKAIAQALLQIPVDEEGALSRVAEKMAVICKGWRLFVEGEILTPELCSLERHDPLLPEDDYLIDKNGKYSLKQGFDFGGIDNGEKIKKIKEELSEEEKAKAATAKKQKEAGAAKKKVEAMRAKESKVPGANGDETTSKYLPTPPTDASRRENRMIFLRKSHPGCILLFKTKSGTWASYGEDANFISDNVKPQIGAKDDAGMMRADVVPARLDDTTLQLNALGRQVGLIEQKDGKETIRKVGTPATPAPKPKTTPVGTVQAPILPSVCKACKGTGKQSKGGPCLICASKK